MYLHNFNLKDLLQLIKIFAFIIKFEIDKNVLLNVFKMFFAFTNVCVEVLVY